MGPPSYIRSIVDRNVVMRRMTISDRQNTKYDSTSLQYRCDENKQELLSLATLSCVLNTNTFIVLFIYVYLVLVP